MDEEQKNLSKEEILEKYREENKSGDERDWHHAFIAALIGFAVLLLTFFAITLVEIFLSDQIRYIHAYIYAFGAACAGSCAGMFIAKAILARKNMLCFLGLGSVTCILSIILFVSFVLALQV